jgi:hypothetical protein
MVETITPVVHGGRGRWVAAVALHVLGATLTAGAFGMLLGGLGLLLGAPFGRAGLLAIATGAVVYALGMVPGIAVSVPVPQLRRQVPSWWRTFFSPRITAFLYGAGLGVGFLTYLSTGVLVVVAAAAFMGGDLRLGAILMAPFGLARGLSATVAANVRSPEDGVRLVDRLSARSDALRRAASSAGLTAVAGFALVDAGRSGGGWTSLALALIAGLFGWAAISKIAAGRRWWLTVAAHRLPAPAERIAAWAVPAAEAIVPVMAMLGYRAAAAGWALILLVGFSAEVIRIRMRRGATVPCGCFGGRGEVKASWLLARNAALAGACLVSISGVGNMPLVRWPGVPSATEILPAALAITGLLVAMIALWQAHRSVARGRA